MLRLNGLLILTIIMLFFNGFCIFVGGKPFNCLLFPLLSLFIILIFNKPKYVINKLKQIYKFSVFKYFSYYVAWLLIVDTIMLLTGKADIWIYYYTFIKLFPTFLLCYLLAPLFIPKFLSLKKLIKLLFITIYAILLWGVIEKIANSFNIAFVLNVVNFFSNMRGFEGCVGDYISGTARVRSIFHEPGSFSQFIFIYFPIIYKLASCKEHIFKNKSLNYFAQNTIIPLAWLDILFAQSPIFFIFSIIISVVIYFRYLKISFTKLVISFGFFTLTLLCLIPLILVFDINIIDIIEHSFIQRIVNIINSFTDFQTFSAKGDSFSIRVVCFVNLIILFFHHPMIGYGFDNARFFLYNQFLNSPIPLTGENIRSMNDSIQATAGGGGVYYNTALLYELLVNTGIIGFVIFIKFMYENFISITKTKKYLIGVEYDFLVGIQYSLIAILISSWYAPNYNKSYISFLYGIIISYLLLVTRRYKNNTLWRLNNG